MPKEKNSASFAISSAVTAPRGTSIMVPTRKSTSTPGALPSTSAATSRTMFAWRRSSSTWPTSGIITSGLTGVPLRATWTAASKIARACMRVISG